SEVLANQPLQISWVHPEPLHHWDNHVCCEKAARFERGPDQMTWNACLLSDDLDGGSLGTWEQTSEACAVGRVQNRYRQVFVRRRSVKHQRREGSLNLVSSFVVVHRREHDR